MEEEEVAETESDDGAEEEKVHVGEHGEGLESPGHGKAQGRKFDPHQLKWLTLVVCTISTGGLMKWLTPVAGTISTGGLRFPRRRWHFAAGNSIFLLGLSLHYIYNIDFFS